MSEQYREVSGGVTERSRKLAQITEELESVKQEMDERGSSMTDGSMSQRIVVVFALLLLLLLLVVVVVVVVVVVLIMSLRECSPEVSHTEYTRGGPKIPEIVKKKLYLKYLPKFETLVPFKVLPL